MSDTPLLPPKPIVRPRRIVFLATVVFYILARRTGAITIKGYCREHDVEFELPPRVEAPLYVKCPVGGEKILRIKAILDYVRKKRGGRNEGV